jgi:type II secretory pathway pseudopilin PulG
MAPRGPYRSRRGALLIEALVSFAIFMVAALAFYGVMAHTRRADAKAREVLAANAYARQLMESQRIRGYSSLALGSSQVSKKLEVQRGGVRGELPLNGTITISNGPGSGVKTILVQVGSGQSSVTLESYVTE